MARFQPLGQGRLINQTATGAVDNAHALFGFCQIFRRQDVAGFVRQRDVQRDKIGARQQIVQINLGYAQLLGAFF